jgi:hypothetical protein
MRLISIVMADKKTAVNASDKNISSNKNELKEEFKNKFEDLKKELKFVASYNELNEVFYLMDYITERGYVSDQLSRQVCSRIAETFSRWNEFLHRQLVPSAGNIVSSEESKLFTDLERDKMREIFNEGMEFLVRHTLIGLAKDKKEEAKFIDDALKFWNTKLKPEAIYVETKIKEMWGQKNVKKKDKPNYSG